MEFIRSRLRGCAFTYFRDSSKIHENNLSNNWGTIGFKRPY